jgi:hypothetical protein
MSSEDGDAASAIRHSFLQNGRVTYTFMGQHRPNTLYGTNGHFDIPISSQPIFNFVVGSTSIVLMILTHIIILYKIRYIGFPPNVSCSG